MTSPAHHQPTGFQWFSEQADAAASRGGIDALDALRTLIAEAEADKLDGYGPSRDAINAARRKWLALYETIYQKETAA